MATKTAIILLRDEAVLIWAIPPLSSQPPDFFDDNHTHIAPLFTIPFPNGIDLHSELIQWYTISSWYFGSSQPLYFDALCRDPKLHRFQIILKHDLSTASLHLINTSKLTTQEFNYVTFQDYMICEDILLSCWSYPSSNGTQCGVYMGSTSACFANVISNAGFSVERLLPDIGYYNMLSWCAASGRSVGLDSSYSLAVFDFF